MKHFFISIIRNTNNEVVSQMLGYDTEKEAEIKFHDEVSYALKRDDVAFANFEVITESGAVVVKKVIGNDLTED